MSVRYDYHKPVSLLEARHMKQSITDSRFVAGGTNLLVQIDKGRVRPSALISLRSIPELSAVTDGDQVRIGAMTTLSDLINNDIIRARFPLLVDAAETMGRHPIRNMATIGGNLCNASPAADLAPPLLALDAIIEADSGNGTRDIPIDRFLLGPGEHALKDEEIVTAIVVPHLPSGAAAAFERRGRISIDLAVASAAVRLEMESGRCTAARVAAGALGPTPFRLTAVEAALIGSRPGDDVICQAREQASKDVAPIDDLRASAGYRRHLAGVLVERAIIRCLDSIEQNTDTAP